MFIIHNFVFISLLFTLGLSGYLYYLVLKNKTTKMIHLIDGFMWLLLVLNVITLFLNIFTSLTTQNFTLFTLLSFVKMIFTVILYIFIFLEVRTLLSQLKQEKIFDKLNSQSVIRLGKNFIFLNMIEIITGITIAFIRFSSSNYKTSFTLQVNIEMIIYLSIGMLLLIIGSIYEKAVDIYDENQLTI